MHFSPQVGEQASLLLKAIHELPHVASQRTRERGLFEMSSEQAFPQLRRVLCDEDGTAACGFELGLQPDAMDVEECERLVGCH